MASDNEIIIFICSGYILIGMALIAMSFSLAQDNLVYVVKHVTTLKSSPENSASNVHGGASTSPKQREILDSMEDIALTLAVSWRNAQAQQQTKRRKFDKNEPTSTAATSTTMEYFVPRSLSEFNLNKQSQSSQQSLQAPNTPIRHNKMVTFEDERPPPPPPSTNPEPTPGVKIKNENLEDVFMW